MTGFDPDAATAAYLTRLTPANRALADAWTATAHWTWLGGGAVAILACWLILKSGLLVRLRMALESERRRPWLATAACAGAFAALLFALQAPWSLFVAWRFDQLRTPHQGLVHLARAMVGQALLAVIFATILVPPVYAVIRAAPRTWWAWVGGFAALVAFAAIWAPFAMASGPAGLPAAPPGLVRDGLDRLIRDTRLPAGEIHVSANPAVDADVTGLPGRPRVVISRGMAASVDPAEARASVGHLIGHYVHGDQLGFAGLLAALTFVGVLAAHCLFRPTCGAIGLRLGAGDPVGMPVMAAILTAWIMLATPVFNAFDRVVNVRADQYSLDHAREPDGLAAAVLREHGGDKADPSPLEEALFYNHPSVRRRLLHAMRWKAAHS